MQGCHRVRKTGQKKMLTDKSGHLLSAQSQAKKEICLLEISGIFFRNPVGTLMCN